MCGRYEINVTPARLKARFDLSGDLFLPERHEYAPTVQGPIIRFEEGERHLSFAKWGLTPSWAKEPKIANSTFNARSDTVAEKPSFRSAFKKRRCLVPASAYFEWQPIAGEKKKRKYRIALADGEPIGFAGLWEWHPGFDGGEAFESYTIITTEPNSAMETIHNRMPVILQPDDFSLWLAPEQNPELLRQLLKPCPSDQLKIEAVG